MIRRTLVAAAFVAVGWFAAYAQTPAQTRETPDFELMVTTRGGPVTIECLRGCGLQWVERQVPNRSDAQKSFTYGPCNYYDWPSGCPSGRLGGWITK
jgi:hypothetical protein